MRRLSILLCLTLVPGAGCVRRVTEVRVDNPGRVQVALRTERGLVPLLPPDGENHDIPLANARGDVGTDDGSMPTVTRADGRIAVEFGAREIVLVDENGSFATTQGADGIVSENDFLYANYEVSRRRAFEPGQAPYGGIPIQLSTPLDNVELARQVSERRKWPAYAGIPSGGAFVLIGALLIAYPQHFNDESAATTLGAVCVVGGLVGIGLGLYALLDRPKVVALVPKRAHTPDAALRQPR
jgi:hypothetical protein